MAVGTFNGSITAGGSTITSINTKSSDIGLVKIDSRGEIVWQKSWGAADYEYVSRITLANEGDGIIINGGSTSSGINASGTGEAIINQSWEVAVVVKFDYSGEVVWQKGYDECSPHFGSIVSNPSGGYIFSGGREPGFAYMLLIDDYGEKINKITWGSGDLLFYDAYATEDEIVAVLSDSMANNWSGAYYLMRYTQEGSIISQIETSADYKSIEPVFDGATLTGYLVAGTNSIAKYDVDGNLVFKHPYRASFVDAFPQPDGSYLALGTFSETIPASGGAEAVSMSLQYNDSVITRFSPETTYYDIEIKSLEPASEYPTSTRSVTVAEGNLLEQPADPSEYAGWQFVGWYEKDENGNFLSEPFDFSSPITRDSTIYTKYERKTYEIPFYMVIYTDSNATEIYDVVEVDRQTVYLGDTVTLPEINTEAYNRVDNIYTGGVVYNSWYRGKVIDGENSYVVNNSMTSRIYRDFNYTSSHISQFDYLFIRMYRKSYTVNYNMTDYDSVLSVSACGEYSGEMAFSSSETVFHGEKIATEIKISSPDKRCVLSSLKSSTAKYGTYTDFDINSSIESDLFIEGQYVRNYLVIRDDDIYYADGTEFNIEEANGIDWKPETNTLTLNNYSGLEIQFENGEEPINLVLIGENDTQIRSSTTPIIISGDGTLNYMNNTNAPYTDAYNAIKALGTSIVIESGTIGASISADNILMNNGELRQYVFVGDYAWSDNTTYDENSSYGFVVNGGTIDGNIESRQGDVTIHDGDFFGKINVSEGNIIINEGNFYDVGKLGANRILINGGNFSGESDIKTESFIMNGGNMNIVTSDIRANIFIVNGGVLDILSNQRFLTSYAIFNDGTVNISGVMPMTVEFPGTIEDLVSSGEVDLGEVTSYFGGFLPTHGAAVEINGGDITFNSLSKDELVDYYLDKQIASQLSMIPTGDVEIAQVCSELDYEDFSGEETLLFSVFKTWRIDIGNLTLVPMKDEDDNPIMLPELDLSTGDIAVDGDGNLIFIPLYNAVDEEENVVYGRVGQGVDENGDAFYFKAGFSDENDCQNNLVAKYPDVMRAYLSTFFRPEIEEDFKDVQPMPAALVVFTEGGIDTSAIYINPELLKEPKTIDVSVATFDEGEGISNFVTFSDGKGEPSLRLEVDQENKASYTAEHILTRARFYEGNEPTPPIPNTDSEDLTEQNSSEKVGNLGHEQVKSSSAVANILVGTITIVLTMASIAIYRKRH